MENSILKKLVPWMLKSPLTYVLKWKIWSFLSLVRQKWINLDFKFNFLFWQLFTRVHTARLHFIKHQNFLLTWSILGKNLHENWWCKMFQKTVVMLLLHISSAVPGSMATNVRFLFEIFVYNHDRRGRKNHEVPLNTHQN